MGYSKRTELGKQAEELVATFLKNQGYSIIDRNVRIGRLEIDIIARKGSLLVFCEVRARSNDRWLTPAQWIDRNKIERIRRAAAQWLSANKPDTTQIRLDAASVVYDVPGGRLDYYERAF